MFALGMSALGPWAPPVWSQNGLNFTNVKAGGNTLMLRWSGGTPPYLIQKKNSVTDTNWVDVLTASGRITTVALDGDRSFYRASDRALTNATPFTAWMVGTAEIPPVTNAAASGFGTFTLEGNRLTYRISFSGLSSEPFAVHVQGPALSTQSGGVIAPLAPLGTNTSGTVSGTLDLSTWTAAQISAFKSGQTYANVHTSLNPAGEIRGQIAPVQFSATLNGTAEVPRVTTSGLGSATFWLIGNQIAFNFTYAGLSGPVFGAHIHGPATPTATSGVLVPLPGISGTSGNVFGRAIASPDNLGILIDALNAGLSYVNVHTDANPAGEIRGQISP